MIHQHGGPNATTCGHHQWDWALPHGSRKQRTHSTHLYSIEDSKSARDLRVFYAPPGAYQGSIPNNSAFFQFSLPSFLSSPSLWSFPLAHLHLSPLPHCLCPFKHLCTCPCQAQRCPCVQALVRSRVPENGRSRGASPSLPRTPSECERRQWLCIKDGARASATSILTSSSCCLPNLCLVLTHVGFPKIDCLDNL